MGSRDGSHGRCDGDGGDDDLAELSRLLKLERMFVTCERAQLRSLHEEVVRAASRLHRVAWITRHQRLSVRRLMHADADSTPHECCARINTLELVDFVDGYRRLSYHESKIGALLTELASQPRLLAACLAADAASTAAVAHDGVERLSRIVVSGVHGNALLRADEAGVLRVLRALGDTQVCSSAQPRRLLQRTSCAFSVVFRLLHDGLVSSRLYLTAALHAPIMALLKEDDWFYDIDPKRALNRFPPAERQRRFGAPGTAEHATKTAQYRALTSAKLVSLTTSFISSLRANMHCFPAGLAWLAAGLYRQTVAGGSVAAAEARAVCADLVFALFICPAICDPEPYGITTDMPISYIARHNLMQVAQILQVLAISSVIGDSFDPKSSDLFEKFPLGCISFLLDSLLDRPYSDEPFEDTFSLPGFQRTCAMMTLSDLIYLMTFLHRASGQLPEGSTERRQIEALLENVPSVAVLQGQSPLAAGWQADGYANTSPSKQPHRGRERRVTLPLDATESHDDPQPIAECEPVLLISLGAATECPGMLSEQKVLAQGGGGQSKVNTVAPGDDDLICESEIHLNEKRTRFSLSHDQDSLVTSDYQEAFSEAASSHSVGSDPEAENDDNLSDMVSANVSGRGTPSISGRDTPISEEGAAGSDDDDDDDGDVSTLPLAASAGKPRAIIVERVRRRAPNLPITVQRSNREDVTDRFGKFEIRQELESRDEAKSTVSDTWSTDVLASDSEPPEQNQFERLEEVVEEMSRQNLLTAGVLEVYEVSETASDAWSTDVLASDTSERQADRLLELDQDELASLGQSRSQGADDEGGAMAQGPLPGLPLQTGALEPDIDDAVDKASEEMSGSDATSTADLPRITSRRDTSLNIRKPIANAAAVPLPAADSQSNDSGPFAAAPPSMKPADFAPGRANVALQDFDLFLSDDGGDDSGRGPSNGGGAPPAGASPAERRASLDAATDPATDAATDALAVGLEDRLKLTEQQNSRIGENRLSGVLGVFNPQLLDAITLPKVTAATAAVPPPGEKTANRAQGARPKVAFMPNITVECYAEAGLGDAGRRREDADGGEKGAPPADSSKGEGRGEGKEEVEERGLEQRKKLISSTGSLLRSFRERISKGSKRKIPNTKPFDDLTKFASLNSAVEKESSDDILARYRKYAEVSSPLLKLNTTHDHIAAPKRAPPDDDRSAASKDDPSPPPSSSSAVDKSRALADAKHKLRLVLSGARVELLPERSAAPPGGGSGGPGACRHRVVRALRTQLAEAINLQERDAIAQLHEAIRCLQQLGPSEIRDVLRQMREEYKCRAPYISYLVRCRQGLLATLAHLERVLCHVHRDKLVCHKYFIFVLVKLFLAKRERSLMRFIAEFQKLTVSDEKVDFVEHFMAHLCKQMEIDPIWQAATEQQTEDGREQVEHYVMSHIYTHAMYPNADIDFMRDQILSEHMKKLASTLTLNHKDLCIQRMYHSECPWPSAQAEIFMISVYKTPRDKLACVVRCCSSIMRMLSLACSSAGGTPAADDFLPVFIYVLLQASPPSLLSTLQYVSSFLGDRLSGEQLYWWTQLVAAVEFIKTMEYSA